MVKKICFTFAPLSRLKYERREFLKRFFDLLVIFKRENVVFICQFPLMENEVVRTLTIHYNFFTMESLILAQDER